MFENVLLSGDIGDSRVPGRAVLTLPVVWGPPILEERIKAGISSCHAGCVTCFVGNKTFGPSKLEVNFQCQFWLKLQSLNKQMAPVRRPFPKGHVFCSSSYWVECGSFRYRYLEHVGSTNVQQIFGAFARKLLATTIARSSRSTWRSSIACLLRG